MKATAELKNRLLFLVSILSILTYIFLPSADASELIITDNGSTSNNEIQFQSQNETTITQTNSNQNVNIVNSSATTGDNSITGSTGESENISTGDTRTEIEVENSSNFSAIETGCCSEGQEVQITENGSDSINQISTSTNTNSKVAVYQNATIQNNISGYANTGGNAVDFNTHGNVAIKTGNINVSGEIINDPINVSVIDLAINLSDFAAKIEGNGFASKNLIYSSNNNLSNVNSYFNADINNNVYWDLNTGGNSASDNIGGNVNISTGDITLDFFIKNLANIGKVKLICCFPEKIKAEEKPPVSRSLPEVEREVGGPGGGGGQILQEAAATQAGGAEVNGLADTSGNSAQSLLFFIGLAMISIGGKIATNELFQVTSKKKQ